jgi:sucrose-6-phosphate hydrolase SacC (GH32 family)
VRELDKLRTARPLRFNGGSFTQAAQWLSTQTNLPPLLDIEMKFAQVSSHSPFAVILHTGPNQQLSIACLPGRGELVVDRRESGLTGFSPQFPGKYAAPLRLVDGECSLRLLVDTSSVETFAQEGTVVLSTLFFPDAGARRLSLTAGGGGKPYVSNLTIHPLQSAWSSADDQRNKEYSISPR